MKRYLCCLLLLVLLASVGVLRANEKTIEPTIWFPLDGNYDFRNVGIGDLDGDGEYELIIKTPNFNVDPYQKEGYWKKSPEPYRLEAYKQDGTLLWKYNMGWAIETGTWYSPWIVYDVDGDGCAEVYCKSGEGDPRDEKGLVTSGPEYLVKLDGKTGKIVARTDWIGREDFPEYNYYCRNFLAVAYLDGKNPSLIMQRGTYNVMKTWALDKDFKICWQHNVLSKDSNPAQNYYGQGSHGIIAADVDYDGRDELIIGAAVIDDNGKGLWSLGMGHPDVCYCADIIPKRRGLEIFYAFEKSQKQDGICVVDAKTGEKIWGYKEKTFHLHGQGMCADILEQYPGMEVYCGERDYQKRWLYRGDGKLIEFLDSGSVTQRPIWWDDDAQKEIVYKKTLINWGDTKNPLLYFEGTPILAVDFLGDWREELITCVKGEMRVYSTPYPTKIKHDSLLKDRQYRLGIANQTSGYYYPAQLSEMLVK